MCELTFSRAEAVTYLAVQVWLGGFRGVELKTLPDPFA